MHLSVDCTRTLTIVPALVLIACAAHDAAPLCFSLREVRRVGIAESPPAEADRPSSNAQPGVLSDIRGVVVGPEDALYVLDEDWHRIIVFRPDGSVARFILGGEGEGPGEFVLPMHITATARGVSVIDYELDRITEFDWSGEVVRLTQLSTPPPWRHVIRDDTAWITYGYSGSTSRPVFHMVLLDGTSVVPGMPLESEDQPYGAAAGVAFGSAGDILVNTARPGVWMAYNSGAWVRRGSPLYPADSPPMTEQMAPRQYRVTPSQHSATGLATIGDSIVVQGIFSFERPFDWNDPPGRNKEVHALGLYRPEGEHLATIRLQPGLSTSVLSSDLATGHIFLVATDPFPQVVEYSLNRCRA